MKLKFKQQVFQTDAVKSVVDCFAGQQKIAGHKYAIDPGRLAAGGRELGLDLQIQAVQRRQILPISTELKVTPVCGINLDIEMETGTGKTYCYIKTMFELHQEYGWGKFIVVVPSIAICEGVLKFFEIMAEHFQEQYGKRARFFVYNSKHRQRLTDPPAFAYKYAYATESKIYA